jgi:hypothetical protein
VDHSTPVAWPATLVERVLAGVGGTQRWRHALLIAVGVLIAGSLQMSVANHPTLDGRISVPLALLSTAPLALIRRLPTSR